MVPRTLGLFFGMAVAATAGYWFEPASGALLGAFAFCIFTVLKDLWKGQKITHWLRHNNVQDPPVLGGIWGDLIDRMRRILNEQRKQTLHEQQRLQDFLLAIQASPNGVVLLDPEGRIEWCNQTAAMHLGMDAKRDLMQHVVHLVRDPVFKKYLTSEVHDGEVVIDGRSASLQNTVKLSVQLHNYGESRQLLLTRDVTAVAQADAMRRDFVANVSHEIRTPLTVMSGFVETLQTLDLNADDQKRYLGLMAIQAVRMQGLVEDLLTLSRLEGSPVPNFANSLPLSSLLTACESEARGLSQTIASGTPHVIEFQSNPMLAHAMLLGEPRELQSALSNLVSNAVRYTPAGGRIDVTVDQGVDGSLVMAVRDTGAGISAEHLPRLTERFYRVDRSRSRESGGTGLGQARDAAPRWQPVDHQ
jgi:two-component system, OmpR family, phosphate regulon sensor histidine kinase PhoR